MKKRIAWFAPMYIQSAIGGHSLKVCEKLSEHYDIDIWSEKLDEYRKTFLNIVFFTPETNLSQLNKYEYIVYDMGNSALYHKAIYDVLARYPGIVIIHDQTYAGFFAYYYLNSDFCSNLKDGFDRYRNDLIAYYGKTAERCLDNALHSGYDPVYTYPPLMSFPMIELLCNKATGIFTHANFYAEKLRNHFHGSIGNSYLSLATPELSDKEKTLIFNLVPKSDRLIIVSTGIVHPVKQIDKVTNVLLKNPHLAEKIQYIVIGGYGGDYGERLEYLSKNELKGCLYMLGYQDTNIMDSAIFNSDLCINLRYPNSEVCSLSLLEQMSFGKPVAVFDRGIYGEMPEDAVIKINFETEEEEIENVLSSIVVDRKQYATTGIAAGKFVSENCSVSKYIKQFIGFLENYDKRDVFYNQLFLNTVDSVNSSLEVLGFNEENSPDTINIFTSNISAMFAQNSNLRDNKNRTIGIWVGFLYPIPNLKREGITRFMVYFLESLMLYYDVDCEIWGYACNEDNIRGAFDTILNNQKFCKRIKIVTEKNWAEIFNIPVAEAGRDHNINENDDNLNILARNYSQASCFLPLILYLDSVIGVGKPIFVPAHDMALSDKYYDFIKKDPLYKARTLDILSRAENLARNGAVFFSSSYYVRDKQILRYVKNLSSQNSNVVYLPTNIPTGIMDRIMQEKEVRGKFSIKGRYLFYPTQIRPYKNVALIVKALNHLKSEFPDLKFVTTGNPEELPEVYDLIKSYNLNDRVICLHDLTEMELYSLYKYAAAVPATSIFEGGGLSWQVCEGLFMDAPVTQALTPIVQERIEAFGASVDNCGFELFDPHDHMSLVKSLEILLKDREAAVKNQEQFKERMLKYSWKEAAAEYYKIIFEVKNDA